MKTTELFDLVAPIAIYHGADVCFKEKAQAALQKIKDHDDDPDLRRIFEVFDKLNTRDWDEYLEYVEPDNLPHIIDIYKDLFREIVTTHKPDWTEFTDRWGACAYLDERGEFVFAGDGDNELPWFETAELLIQRLNL